jgi:UDP-N-acetylglucosamine diphosphorylase/glucosamine-1-phosphate N-acetyltransferase
MGIVLFDDNAWLSLKPLSFTRPVAEVRVGILTIREKWAMYLKGTPSHLTQPYLSKKFPAKIAKENLLVNASVLPTAPLVERITRLELGQTLVKGELIIAVKCTASQVPNFNYSNTEEFQVREFDAEISRIVHPWDIFSQNGKEIIADFKLLTHNRKSASIDNTNTVIGDNVFVEEDAKITCAILNSTTGPIYIGKHTEIMEGSIVRGPFALCDFSSLKLGSKIYGSTTIGPHSKVGGEVSESVIFGYSNKAHDGYLGNSVIGEWCNLGANTNVSNLKNNFALVKMWSHAQGRFIQTGLQFCGIIMGDYSKTGINSMFSTGTSIGVCTNFFGSGFPRNIIPSFAWGGTQGYITYKSCNYLPAITATLARRCCEFSEIDKEILATIFEQTEKERSF